jgi:hypothetical protein
VATNYPEEGRLREPKRHPHGPITSEKKSPLWIRKWRRNWQLEEWEEQLRGQYSRFPTPEVSTQLHSSVLCLLLGTCRNSELSAPTCDKILLPTPQRNLHRWISWNKGSHCYMDNRQHNQQALFSHACSTTVLGFWKTVPGQEVPELLLPTDFVLSCLQQLLWLLEAYALVPVNPRASPALWAPEKSSLLAWLSHGHTQLAITWASEPQTPCFAILLVPAGFPPHRAWTSSIPHYVLQWENPCCPV